MGFCEIALILFAFFYIALAFAFLAIWRLGKYSVYLRIILFASVLVISGMILTKHINVLFMLVDCDLAKFNVHPTSLIWTIHILGALSFVILGIKQRFYRMFVIAGVFLALGVLSNYLYISFFPETDVPADQKQEQVVEY